jgi:transcriptional regulator with XRE-family HTH domain
MDTDLSVALRRARGAKGMTIRELAAAAKVATGTVTRYESGPVPVVPKTLHKLADALGVSASQDASGVWTLSPAKPVNDPNDHAESNSVVADGNVVVTLRVPAAFYAGLPAEQRAAIEADALLELMRLARQAQREAPTT